MTDPIRAIDVHQHLWPEAFVDALRQRKRAPRLVGWTLYLDGEAPYEVVADDHDAARRAGLDCVERIVVALSSPLGIEYLPGTESEPLLNAWHSGVASLGDPFTGWASVSHVEPDLALLTSQLTGGFAGVQVAAGELATPSALERLAPVLRIAESTGRPVLVHPGPIPARAVSTPPWWPAVVDYVAQLQAAWWSWRAAGRSLLPDLRICFAAGAGLAPLLGERSVARGGPAVIQDASCFVDTSSHGPLALRALVATLGESALVLGSDRPYATPTDPDLGPDVSRAVRSANPDRLLSGR